MLPDDTLLEIMDFCKVDTKLAPVGSILSLWHWALRWKTLSQVCRKWRHVVFGSPRRLDLRVVCTEKTPTRTLLDVWPPLPIIVMCVPWHTVDEKGVENVIAALEHRDRISQIYILSAQISALQKLVAAMEQPFPVLTHFQLTSTDGSLPVLPETFLGGSAPCLRSFLLRDTPFPTLPKFALSATHITDLDLLHDPNSGYVSPEVMATCMAALSNLKSLSLGFRSLHPSPDQSTSPPSPRTGAVLPALTRLSFKGSSDYLDDLVARIDTPLLERLIVAFFKDAILHTRRLHDFIERTDTLRPFNQAVMELSGRTIKITLGSPIRFELEIRCEGPESQDSQLSSMTQMFSQQLPLLFCVEQLEICEARWETFEWRDDPHMGSSLWLELFRLFISAQNLYVSKKLVRPVVAALQELKGERTLEVLPALRNLYLEGPQPSGPVQELITSFISSRQLSDHHVVVQRWERYQWPRVGW